jgi:Tfp pilus assembly protein PilN
MMGLLPFSSRPYLIEAFQVLYIDIEKKRHFQWLRTQEGSIDWKDFPSYENLLEAASEAKVDATFIALPRSLFYCAKLSLPVDIQNSLAEAVFYRIDKTLLIPRKEALYTFCLSKDTAQNTEGLLLGIEKKKMNDLLAPLMELDIPLAGVFVASLGFSYLLSKAVPRHALILSEGKGQEILLAEGGKIQDSIYLSKEASESLSKVAEIKTAPHSGPRLFIEGLAENNQETTRENGEKVSLSSLDPTPLLDILLSHKGGKEWALGFNLLPEEERRLKSETKKRLIVSLNRVAIGMALAALIASPLIHYELANRQAEAALHRLKPVAQKTKELDKNNERYQTLLGKVAHFLPARSKLDIIAELVALMPKGTTLNIVSIRSNTLQLEGYTPSASRVLQSLERSSFFHNATFMMPVTKGKGYFKGLEGFGIKAEIGS